MMEYVDYLKAIELTSIMGILLYWVPLSLCAFGYTIRTWVNYQKDVKERTRCEMRGDVYHPTDTIGTLIARGLATMIPIINLWAAAFDVAPKMFGRFFGWLDAVFNQPLVPRKK